MSKPFLALLVTVALIACKQPTPLNPADFVGCYYNQQLPFIRITPSSFEVPDLHYVDNDVRFERIKGRNLIWLSSPYGIKQENGSIQFSYLGKYTRATSLNYELRNTGIVITPFPEGDSIIFFKQECR